jgi:tripartite ATP-independent transporter DctM subunit
MGIMLEASGVAEDLLDTMQLLLGRVRGGLAMAVTLMGTILAASTGIIGASVVMMGVLALPPMLRRGYSKELAVGTICASGTLGILIPPSIMLVLMGDLMSISVGELFMGAFVPGLLLSFLYLVYIGTVSTIRPAVAPLPPREDGGVPAGVLARRVLRSFVPPTAMILLVLGSIFMGWATPTEASGVGAAGAILLALANRRLTGRTLADVVQRTALTASMVFIIFVGATGFSYVFRSLGGEDQVDRILLALPFGAWGILTILMGVIFFLGFFFDWVEITLIVLPVFGPIVQELDFGTHLPDAHHVVLWFAILVAVNLQTSFLTPPFGFALFYLKGVAPPDVAVGHIYRGIVPFVVLQLIGLACVIAFPRLATWLPDAVFK